MASQNVRSTVQAIIHFLIDQKDNGPLTSDSKESVEVAIQCLESAFEVDHNDYVGSGIPLQTQLGMAAGPACDDGKSACQVTDEIKAKAESLKCEGNNLVKDDKYAEAIECYSKAIALDASNAVYYCNRAAAHSKLGNHHAAIKDCKSALVIDSTYSKAYGRLGLAYSSLGQHNEALTAYKRALELDPENESYRTNLTICEGQVRGPQSDGQNHGPNLGTGGPLGAGMGPLGALGAALPGMDLGSVLNNPALLNMASQLMGNPQMQQMMSNLMSSGGGAPGGEGGIDALLTAGQELAQQMQNANPDLVDQLRRQMGARDPNEDQGGNDNNGKQ